MKILIVGDIHGNYYWHLKVIDIAKRHNIKTILQCGDWGLWPGQSGRDYRDIVSSYLEDEGIDLFWLPGNHEDFDQIEEFPNKFDPVSFDYIQTDFTYPIYEINQNIFYLNKVNSWQWAGKQFASVGGAVSIDRRFRKIHESWWPQEQLTDEEVEKAKSLGKVDYLFTHDCPQAHPFRHLVPDLESEIHRWKMTDIARQLDPMLWFHGHMHIPAKYSFDGRCTVYSLDCDNSSMRDHVKILDVDSGEVTEIKEWIWERGEIV